jgi:hypothetical protein
MLSQSIRADTTEGLKRSHTRLRRGSCVDVGESRFREGILPNALVKTSTNHKDRNRTRGFMGRDDRLDVDATGQAERGRGEEGTGNDGDSRLGLRLRLRLRRRLRSGAR